MAGSERHKSDEFRNMLPFWQAGSAPWSSGARSAAHADVLFVGAHPDDEFWNLSTFGQWKEDHDVTTGIVTITRGEGGGNAVGLEEGAALGLIREVEERAATALVGIDNIFYLDKPDFWYTLSAPLVARIWGEGDTLQRIVRLIWMTTPHTVITMDPRPFDQHGGHRLAARLTIEAFLLAGDPEEFAGQLADEGLSPWRPRRLLTQNFRFAGLLGPAAATQLRTDPGTGLPVFGVWSGRRSREHGTTWAQVERDAARIYRTQGFAAFPPEVPTDPECLDSDWFTVLADDGELIEVPLREQHGLRPLYANFRDWAQRVGLPWLANDAQPDYPAAPATTIPAVAVAPALNAVAGEDEYPGPALPLTYWQGDRAGHPLRLGDGEDLPGMVRTCTSWSTWRTTVKAPRSSRTTPRGTGARTRSRSRSTRVATPTTRP
jgi:mycothiol S-conjugate amidase